MESLKMKDRIISVISELGLSMRELSLDMNKSGGFVASVKNGKGFPSMELVYRILDTYPQISPSWLVLGKGDMIVTSDTQNADNSERKDYKKLYEEEREETIKLRDDIRNWRDTMLETMKKNERLVVENARLSLELNSLKSSQDDSSARD